MRKFASKRGAKPANGGTVITGATKARADATKALLERRYAEKAKAREDMEARCGRFRSAGATWGQ